jgi:hypothetical protein
MLRHWATPYIICCFVAAGIAAAGYFLWLRFYFQPFTCQASFVQHYPDETLTLSLNYRIEREGGLLSIHGRVDSDPTKKINRKIAFSLNKKNDVYLLQSGKNIKFPGDTVDDRWLRQYEPAFFVYPGEKIYVQISEQKKDNYLFIFSSLPTYVCHSQ